ncbi:hypothetical protein D1007_17599 [Hordeum vulgare]|nr:hypothetical protein D1007_17599 [Hordeum vulgare]KAI4996653.1 hypothetical protein ZWY2020_051573 [Hordeum vulgare]
MARIVLLMDVHCNGCANDIRKALRKFAWVESVSASYETGLVNVEVEGMPASYETAVVLKLRLTRKMRNKPVTIVSYGGSDDEQPPSSPAPPPPPGGYGYPLDGYYNYDLSRGEPYYVPNYAVRAHHLQR